MNEWFEIHALLDDELTPEERIQVQERMKTCKVRQAEWIVVRQLKGALETKCTEPECEDAWKRCVKRLDQMDRAKKAEYFVGRYSWAICGAFFLMILGAATLNRFSGSGLHTGDVVTASFGPFTTPRSQAPNDVVSWLDNQLNENRLPVKSSRISFMDGAIGRLRDGRRITKADLKDDQGLVTIFIVEKADKVDDVQQVDGHVQYSGGSIGNLNCISWTDGGNAYVLTGYRPIEALCLAADKLYSKQ